MKKWLIVIVLLFPFLATGQNSRAMNLFNKGKTAFDLKDYKKAERFFQKSAYVYASDITQYYLGKTKLILGDTCDACNGMKFAGIWKNAELKNLYFTDCVLYDTIYYTAKQYYCVVTTWSCSGEKEVEFFERSSTTGSDMMVFLKNDSAIQNLLYCSQDFNIEKYLDEKPSWRVVSELPEFLGGEMAMMDFLAKNMHYPVYARDHNIQGIVHVRFVILKDGSVSHVRVTNGVGGGLDEEAVRVVKAMPDWIPGKAAGKPVNMIYNIPIRFILQ